MSRENRKISEKGIHEIWFEKPVKIDRKSKKKRNLHQASLGHDRVSEQKVKVRSVETPSVTRTKNYFKRKTVDAKSEK